MRHVGAAQRAHQSDLAQQPIDAGRVGPRAGHPQHHALVTAQDQIKGVLRAPGQLFQHGLFAFAGGAIRVQPASQHACI